MRTVTHREMRNNSGEILRAVAAGETVQVTNNGQIAAVISPPDFASLDRLEIASIWLDANEDAQAIFETPNTRGTPLSATDLIKHFAFQNLDTTAIDAERAYLKYWAEFETPWWEMTVTTGRITHMRASLFLWQWLIARTQNDFPIREVFVQFKHYVNTVA